jgi:Uma2 family endonuclease
MGSSQRNAWSSAEEAAIEITPRGQATMRKALKQAGAEPDESWCIHGEKEFADLALEVALPAGGLSKLEIYRQMNVPEVWLWRREALEVFVLVDDGDAYQAVLPEPAASESRYRAPRELCGDPFMATGPSRLSRCP